MNKKLIPLILAGTAVLTACDQKSTDATSNSSTGAATASVSKEDAIASVNGKYISKAALASLEAEIAQRGAGQSFPKEKLVEELIQRELLIQDASQKELDKTTEFTERLATIKQSLLSQAAIQNFIKSNPITDAALEAEYKKNVAGSGTEYKARHILVKSEEEANQIITELSNGADFVELAKTKSTGPSGPQGGDLGWFAAGQMVAPFSDAVIALENNKFTTAPVKTQFGWHVILREDSRSQTPPPLEAVKEQIRPMLQRQMMQQYMDSLRQNAKIEMLLPAPAPVPATAPGASTSDAASQATAETEQAAKNAIAEIKQAVENAAENTAEQVEKTTEAAEKEIANAVTETIEKANQSVSEGTEKATQALDALAK